MRMTTFLVTGSNRGIGLEYCRQLHARGDQVIAVCRQSSDELNSIGVRIEEGIELSDEDSIQKLVARLTNTQLNGVILNAGILRAMRLDELNSEAILEQFKINALAPLLQTKALLPLMCPGSKLALMTSRMGSIEDNTSGGSYGSRMSKVALNIAAKSLAIDLKPKGIAVAILHPGLVRTRMTAFNANGIEPSQSVAGLLTRIDELNLENSGTFWHANGTVLPW